MMVKRVLDGDEGVLFESVGTAALMRRKLSLDV